MHKHKHRRRVYGPWHGLHGAIWMIGLAVLFWHGWWWPGILVLVGINMVLESMFRQSGSQTFEDREREMEWPKSSSPPPAAPPPTRPFSQEAGASGRRLELLPATCPQCGGPIRGHEVKWTDSQSAACPFCGTNLPMKKI